MKKLVINEEELRVAMARAGIYSMAELSRQANLHMNTVYSLTDETKVFTSVTVDRIAEALGCDPLVLLDTVEVSATDTQYAAPVGVTDHRQLVAA